MTQDEKDFEKNLKIRMTQIIEKEIESLLYQLPLANASDKRLFRRTCWMAVEAVVQERLT